MLEYIIHIPTPVKFNKNRSPFNTDVHNYLTLQYEYGVKYNVL